MSQATTLVALLHGLPVDVNESHIVCDISAALTHLEQHACDGIVTALDLPDTRGFDAVLRLHSAAPTLPITVVATLEDEKFAKHALALGAQEYVVEGTFSAPELITAVTQARERKDLERRLSELSQLDRVTGLRNRALLRDRFDHLLQRARREKSVFTFAVLVVDDPEPVPDMLHIIGDELTKHTRGSDSIGRFAHNQFGLLLEGTSPEYVSIALTRLLTGLLNERLYQQVDGKAPRLQVGTASYPCEGEMVEDLIRHANHNLQALNAAIAP